MAKVYIDAGHGGSDPGAVKYVVERDVNLVMAQACNEYLKVHGVETMMSRTSNNRGTSINSMAEAANKWGADLVMSLHNNAGKGDGVEIYYSIAGGTGKVLAQNIEAEIKKLGQNSRGCKTRKGSNGSDYYGMIRLTNAPAVICEGAFVDNATDVKIIDTTAEQKAFGYAYARGALKTLGIKDKGLSGASTKPVSTTTEKPSSVTATDTAAKKDKYLAGTYKVTADSGLNIRHGAGASKEKMVAIPKGTKVQNYGYYTVADGVKWLYVQFTYKRVKYTGFASSKYLKKQ